jgi:peptidoglycan hydrolase CwlO-like protein
MQYPSDNTNTNRTWDENEIRELILYAKAMQEEVETKTAQIIMIQAKLNNEEAKVKRLTMLIRQFTNVN